MQIQSYLVGAFVDIVDFRTNGSRARWWWRVVVARREMRGRERIFKNMAATEGDTGIPRTMHEYYGIPGYY